MASRLDLIRYYIGRLGKAGVAGMLLLLGSLFFITAVVQPKEAALAERVSRNAKLLQAEAARRTQSRRETIEPSAMPALAPEAAAALHKLYAAASEAGVELVQGDYRLVPIEDAGLTRYQLMLPVYGSYPALRSFLAQALNQEPALALSAMQLRRDIIESTELEAVLNFALFLEGTP